MTNPESALHNGTAPRKGKRYFTLADARRALPLVKRITADIQGALASRHRLHAELSSKAMEVAGNEHIRKLQNELEKETTRIEGLIEELQKVGVDLKDPARGLLDFPAVHDGREILFCWKAGEETISYWHEADSGYAGRRLVEEIIPQS